MSSPSLAIPAALTGIDGRRPTVWIAGVGGTGSMLADAFASLESTLARLGHPGFDVLVFDPDVVSASNLGRQRYVASDIGHPKVVVLTHRINAFYELDWSAHVGALEPSHLRQQTPDLLITCLDRAVARAELAQAMRAASRPFLWLDTGNTADRGAVVLGHSAKPAQGLHVPNVADLYPELAGMQAVDEEAPSCSTEEAVQRQQLPINRAVATAALDLLWALFRTGALSHHGTILHLNPFRAAPLMLDPVCWKMLHGFESGAAPQQDMKAFAPT